MFPNLTTRASEPELMDAPDCDTGLLLATLAQFDAMNRRLTRYPDLLRQHVVSEMHKDPTRVYHVADLGAGGCDIDRWLIRTVEAEGLQVKITAYDADPRIVDFAKTANAGIEAIDVVQRDVLAEGPDRDFDFIFGQHFLHHLSDDEIIDLLRRWMPRVRIAAVFSDLLRSHLSYYAYMSYAALFCRNSFALEDGLTSIRKGFRPRELGALALRSGVSHQPRVKELFPARLALVLQEPTAL